jgi:hypothetical protein
VRSLRNAVTTGNIPHMLFYGPPGTGKTSTILAMCRDLYGCVARREAAARGLLLLTLPLPPPAPPPRARLTPTPPPPTPPTPLPAPS